MVEKSEDVATDDYGTIEVRTVRERVDFLTDTLDVLDDFSRDCRQTGTIRLWWPVSSISLSKTS